MSRSSLQTYGAASCLMSGYERVEALGVGHGRMTESADERLGHLVASYAEFGVLDGLGWHSTRRLNELPGFRGRARRPWTRLLHLIG